MPDDENDDEQSAELNTGDDAKPKTVVEPVSSRRLSGEGQRPFTLGWVYTDPARVGVNPFQKKPKVAIRGQGQSARSSLTLVTPCIQDLTTAAMGRRL